MYVKIARAMIMDRDSVYNQKKQFVMLLGDIEKRIRETPNDSDAWARFYRTIQILHSFQDALDALDSVIFNIKNLRMEAGNESDDQA